MRIALFHHLPDGGAKIAAFEQVKRLAHRHAIELYTFMEEGGEYDLSLLVNKVHLYPYEAVPAKSSGIHRIMDDLNTFTILKNLHKTIASQIDQGGFDLVLVYHSRLTQAPYLLRFLQTPSLYYCQEPLRMAYEFGLRLTDDVGPIKKLYEAFNRVVRKRIDRTNAGSASAVATGSRYSAQYIAMAYDLKPTIIPLGVDAQVFRPGKSKRSGILFVAPKVKAKGFDVLSQALELIPEEKRPKLTVVAPDPKGTFSLTTGMLVTAYQSALVTVCASGLEPFGMTALESMACETPVVAIDEGGYRETVLNGRTGFLVPREPGAVAEKIQKLAANPHIARRLGQTARKHVLDNWTWEKGVKTLEEKMRQVASLSH